jgi:hypothetical protein
MGRTVPLSNDEWMRWQVYYGRVAQRQEMATLRAQAKGKGR